MLVAKRNNTNTIGSRYSYLGLLKFLASMGIVIVHTLDQNANWGKLWYLVEFYFFITGFFTYRHFQQRRIPGKKTSIELKAKRAFAYSHKKFSYIFPYIIIGTFLKGITSAIASQGDGLKAMLFAFRSAPFDVFYARKSSTKCSLGCLVCICHVYNVPDFLYNLPNKKNQTTYCYNSTYNFRVLFLIIWKQLFLP